MCKVKCLQRFIYLANKEIINLEEFTFTNTNGTFLSQLDQIIDILFIIPIQVEV